MFQEQIIVWPKRQRAEEQEHGTKRGLAGAQSAHVHRARGWADGVKRSSSKSQKDGQMENLVHWSVNQMYKYLPCTQL